MSFGNLYSVFLTVSQVFIEPSCRGYFESVLTVLLL